MGKEKKNGNGSEPVAETVQTTELEPIPPQLRARNNPADIQDELQAEYVKANDLAGMGRFNIVGAYVRESQFGEECAFEVQLLDGVNRGATATVTFKETPVRRKLVDIVKKRGSVGPYVLQPVGENTKGNKPWGFVPADGSSKVPF
jgi:hypothetical protein